MSLSPMSYKSKIDLTISQLPSASRPLFHAALRKHHFSYDKLSPEAKANGKGPRSRNDMETVLTKYLITETFDKDNELFKKQYSRLKRGSNSIEGLDRDESKKDCLSSENIFLPSLILDKTSNIKSTLMILDIDEANREKELVERCSIAMMNIKKNWKEGKPLQWRSLPVESPSKHKAPKPSKQPSSKLNDEKLQLISDIRRSRKTFKSLSELPEYCMTTLCTKEATNPAPIKPKPPKRVSLLSKVFLKGKPLSISKAIKKKSKLTNLYDSLLINHLTQEQKHIVNYFKKHTKRKVDPVNYETGSNLHELLIDFQSKTIKVNIPEKIQEITNNHGSIGINLEAVNRIKRMDQRIQGLNHDCISKILFK